MTDTYVTVAQMIAASQATPTAEPVLYSRQLAMVFDTETTGLLKTYSPPLDPTSLATYPHILQISYAIFDTQTWSVVSTVNTFIRVPDDVEITPEITRITGITREMCNAGMPIDVAMHQFYTDYMRCNAIVAHNLDFDRAMIKIEFSRIGHSSPPPCPNWDKIFDPEFEKACDKETVCTMRWGRNLCKIERIDRNGKRYWKSPKLAELYEHLFQEPAPDGLHNALVDTLVCLRCYVKLRFRFTLRMDTYQSILTRPTHME